MLMFSFLFSSLFLFFYRTLRVLMSFFFLFSEDFQVLYFIWYGQRSLMFEIFGNQIKLVFPSMRTWFCICTLHIYIDYFLYMLVMCQSRVSLQIAILHQGQSTTTSKQKKWERAPVCLPLAVRTCLANTLYQYRCH
jgi:hypothetical protein